MNLNEYKKFDALDVSNMYAAIEGLPEQLADAFALGMQQPLPEFTGLKYIIVAGMGGSAIGSDLLAGYMEGRASLPLTVHRDYDLPAWAKGPETLVIASSHSGNTEETLSAFGRALENGCQVVAVTRGGKLAKAAQGARAAWWQFEHDGQPRAAVGFSFGLLLAMMNRLRVIPDPAEELAAAVAAMKARQAVLAADVPVAENPAKQMAETLAGKWVSVFASGMLSPVARRWKGQISEVAKAWAQFEYLPETDHNTLAGVFHPKALLPQMRMVFLGSASDHERNKLRLKLTRKVFEDAGLQSLAFQAAGDDALSQMWTTLHFGDYLAYYLAMTYEVDPTPVEAIDSLKKNLVQ
ncbi:MAG: bifunctional phosphoglucose/phosphomannose isomerase [Anaerolineaceae bacterium]|jgi:glucose/mannose-6-phosphate isomerase|nr:bifunctional phosphoglucose/phosphomannose isomerase [Anaerolineaceae bacterium]